MTAFWPIPAAAVKAGPACAANFHIMRTESAGKEFVYGQADTSDVILAHFVVQRQTQQALAELIGVLHGTAGTTEFPAGRSGVQRHIMEYRKNILGLEMGDQLAARRQAIQQDVEHVPVA